jgi:hypothetical protein
MDDLKTMAAGAVNTGVEQLHKLHDKLDANLALALVVGGMAVIGAMKAIGKMPHPASRMIGRGELLGAMFMILPRIILKGFGRVAGCCVIFAVMGAMMVGLALSRRVILHSKHIQLLLLLLLCCCCCWSPKPSAGLAVMNYQHTHPRPPLLMTPSMVLVNNLTTPV